MKILVTGGAGFIGSNVVDGYLAEGHEVVVIDDLSTGRRGNVNKSARFHKMDIRSGDLLSLLLEERPQVINHHAAQISVPDSVENPLHDADINVSGFLNLMEASRKAGVRKVILISSGGAIYGEAKEYPTTENCEPKPISPYAVSKYASENYLRYYRHQYGIDYITLRYANVYGPRQVPHGEAGVVAIFMDNLLAARPSVVNHYPDDTDGMIRDYCFVGDVVKANLAALEKGSCDFVNIGTGAGTKTMTLYETIFKAVKSRIPGIPQELARPDRRLARPGDLTRSCLVAGKAKKVLDWEPQTELKDGIDKTVQWRLAQL
ncbi:MAG: NAD-dependent epimerase/dehydratase family protein [Desulfobacteraceae bacterium]|nr:MAG: NAD-dependent epimerase/dehydratase family protein [Desulfobacteraceae bacterium]